MLEDIKKELINNPEKLIQVLEHYGYCNVINHGKYISFGRDEFSSKKSIVIQLENNDYIWIKDYARNISKDLFAYIIEQRKVEFTDVLNTVKSVLGITDYYSYFDRKKVFGGFYERIRKKNISKQLKTYDLSILDDYKKCCNKRFLVDNISLRTQKRFNICYDIESQGIVIPIYTQTGELMGVKCRKNYEDDDMKYFYLVPCQASNTLYGFCQNYNNLVDSTIYVYESEKATMQCDTYGLNNCVSLGSGSISSKQIQMILECRPKRVVFMHDNQYDIEAIMGNIRKLKNYSRFSDMEVGYWNWTKSKFKELGKVSPSDLGKNNLEYIIENEIEMISEVDDEEI